MGEPTSGNGTIPLSGCKPVFGQKHTERPLRKAKTDASVRQKGLFENSETTRPRRPPLSFPFEDNTPEGLRALLAANRHYREVAWPVRMGLRPTNRDENPCKCFGGRALAGAGLKPRLQQHRQRGWVFDCAAGVHAGLFSLGKVRASEGGQFCPQPAFSRLRRAQLACAAKSGSAADRVSAPRAPTRPPTMRYSTRQSFKACNNCS